MTKRFFAILLLGFVSTGRFFGETLLPRATIVVYNRDLPESVELAKFYAQARGIADDHLIAFDCSQAEEISREEYDQTIAEPLRVHNRPRITQALIPPNPNELLRT